MRMHSQEVSDAVIPGENGDTSGEGTQEASSRNYSRQKYRELKSRLKYLIYEQTCFESEMSRAQGRLVELLQDRTVLLDQLLQYEPTSEDEEEATDYSSSENEVVDKKLLKTSYTKEHVEDPPHNMLPVSSGVVPPVFPSSSSSSSPAMRTGKSNDVTKPGISRATAIVNSSGSGSSSTSTAAAVLPPVPTAATQLKTNTKSGTKRQSKGGKTSGGSASKISKTVSRVRQMNAHQQDIPLPISSGLVSKLVVSYPITAISTEVALPSSASTLTTLTISSSSSSSSSSAFNPLSSAHRPLPSSSKPTSSSLHVSSVGGVHVTTISTTTTATSNIPPLIPIISAKKMRRGSSTSSSSGSSSSSESESRESGSESSSSTGDEDEEVVRGVRGPVRLVSTVKMSSDLPRPKAILSPVKLTRRSTSSPLGGPMVSPATLVSPRQVQAQAAFTNWTQSPRATEDNGSPCSSSVTEPVTGFLPLAPPLSSPSLPFSSMSKAGGGGSAFQVFSPKLQSQVVAAVSPPQSSGGSPAPVTSVASTPPTVAVDGKGLCMTAHTYDSSTISSSHITQ